MNKTKIEWTEKSWNPITGCTSISLGCAHCYAKTMSKRLKAMGVPKYKNEFKVTTHEECLQEPLRWKKSSMVFVCSMSDIFHKEVPFSFVDSIISIIKKTPQHTYQILTKRPQRMYEYFKKEEIPDNVWLGTTVEMDQYCNRADYLRLIEAKVRFLSCEPLLGQLNKLNVSKIDWIIAGGESGPGARPMKKEWVIHLRNLAQDNKIPFFFKQWGAWGADGIKRSKAKNGKLLEGKIIQEFPLK